MTIHGPRCVKLLKLVDSCMSFCLKVYGVIEPLHDGRCRAVALGLKCEQSYDRLYVRLLTHLVPVTSVKTFVAAAHMPYQR